MSLLRFSHTFLFQERLALVAKQLAASGAQAAYQHLLAEAHVLSILQADWALGYLCVFLAASPSQIRRHIFRSFENIFLSQFWTGLFLFV